MGRFSFPTLPSVLDFLPDTSPQVFYPASRPSSRASNCPVSPERVRHRTQSSIDRRTQLPCLPLPPFPYSAHPRTASPLDATTNSSASTLEPQQEPLWEFGALTLDTPNGSTRRRPTHRRSQSSAAVVATTREYRSDYHTSHSKGLERPFELRRDSITSSSALSLPTLAEDNDDLPPRPPMQRGRTWIVEPTTYTHSRRGSNATIAGQFVTHTACGSLRHRATISFGAPASPALSRRGSFASLHGEPTPMPVPATVSVSDVAATATMAQEPSTPSRRDSLINPSETLRARLRSLSQLEGRGTLTRTESKSTLAEPGTPPRLLSPATPRSNRGTPGHSTRGTPGSSTPTSSNHHHLAPPSPTPTTRRLMRSHSHRHSMPDATLLFQERPTTSRLRQPAQLSMGAAKEPSWEPNSTLSRRSSAKEPSRESPQQSKRFSLEMPPPPPPARRSVSPCPPFQEDRDSEAPEFLLPHNTYRSVPRDTPGDLFSVRPPRPPRRGSVLSTTEPVTSEQSSPGSLVSDSGSMSPTSVESLSLGPALMRERERAREEAQTKLTLNRSSSLERAAKLSMNRSNSLERAQLKLTTMNEGSQLRPMTVNDTVAQLKLATLDEGVSASQSKLNDAGARPQHDSRRSYGPAWKARRTRLTQSMHLDEEKFLDFDDI